MENKMLMWCNNVMQDEVLQKELEKRIVSLLEGPLKLKSDYAQEKCIKSFYEGLVYLEKLLLKQNDIHPHDAHQIIELMHTGRLTKEEFARRNEMVRSQMLSEISRQHRHFLTFL